MVRTGGAAARTVITAVAIADRVSQRRGAAEGEQFGAAVAVHRDDRQVVRKRSGAGPCDSAGSGSRSGFELSVAVGVQADQQN